MSRKNSGFTLIEMLIALAIAVLVIGVIVAFQRDLFSVNNFLRESFSIQRDSELVIRELVSELRTASQSNLGAYPLAITGSTSIAFYSNIDKDQLKERVHYFLDGTMLKKSIVKPTGQPLTYSTTTAQETLKVVLRDVVASSTQPLFTYYDSNYVGAGTPPLVQPVNVSAVRLISINIIVDKDPQRLPPSINVSSQVTIRNLKNNL